MRHRRKERGEMNQTQMRGSAVGTRYRCDRGSHPQEGGKGLPESLEIGDRLDCGFARLIAVVLWPALERFLPNYPDIKAEIVVDNGLIDIVAERFDASVRTGNIIAKDMIAVPIGPDIRRVFVGSPSYLTTVPAPKIPQDLTSHRCINLRLPTHGGIYAWEFEKGGRECACAWKANSSSAASP
jgi:DNA-binding transcriptional LysR family regulator